MKVCPNCKKEIENNNAEFCPDCGTHLTRKPPKIKLQKDNETADTPPVVETPAETPVSEPQPEIFPVPETPPYQEMPYQEMPYQEMPNPNTLPPYQGMPNPNPNPNPNMPPYQGMPNQNFTPPFVPDIYDHTSEFDPKDISDNKVIAMLVYLMGIVGVILAALIGANTSPYVAFHIRQSLKFMVVEILLVLCCAILFWTIIVPVVAGIFEVVLSVVKIICFVQICQGQAKEPAIIRSFGFLK